MDPRTRNTIGPVTTSTLNIAKRVLAHLEDRGTPLPRHPDPNYPFPVIWGKGSSSEHATGRALDFMVPTRRDIGDAIADYLWSHRNEFGLVWVIWRQRIRSTAGNGEWRWMEDRGSATENHMDHPHALFSGKYVSPPTGGKPATKKPATKPTTKVPTFPGTVKRGSRGAAVRAYQSRLRARGWRIAVDGIFGKDTERIVRAFQKEKRLIVDGIAGRRTWDALWTSPVT